MKRWQIWIVIMNLILQPLQAELPNYLHRSTIQTYDSLSVQEGDLLFQQSNCGPLCDAIEEVTQGFRGAKFSHIGLVFCHQDSFFVIEAISKGVTITPLGTFLERSLDNHGHPKVCIGRLKKEFTYLIKPTIGYAMEYVGKPYDNYYSMDNDSYYCSELIYLAFYRANNNKPFFPLQPMTYISPKSGKTFPVWESYFKSMGVPVPEGKPGINPGGISQSPNLNIIYSFGWNPEIN